MLVPLPSIGGSQTKAEAVATESGRRKNPAPERFRQRVEAAPLWRKDGEIGAFAALLSR